MNVFKTTRVSIRRLTHESIPALRTESSHDDAMDDLLAIRESMILCGFDEEIASRLMRGFFADYINKNRIAEKAAAENCTTMEYLGLDEIEIFCLIGEVEE